MDNKSAFAEPAVFSIYFEEENYYRGAHPRFYDPNDFPWVKKIESQWEIMRDEILGYLGSGKNELENFTSPMSPGLSRPGAWKKIYFMNFLWLQRNNCRRLPKTWNILKQIPGVTLAGVLILDPRSSLLPHCSESNINIRCHLGIKIPGEYPLCGIRVDMEERGWQEGKVMMFSDCYEHSVWNRTDEIRVIVAFDVLKHEFAPKRTWMCARYLGALSLRSLDKYVPFIRHVPGVILRAMHNLASAGWYCYLPLQTKA